jgi:hypothetical protein
VARCVLEACDELVCNIFRSGSRLVWRVRAGHGEPGQIVALRVGGCVANWLEGIRNEHGRIPVVNGIRKGTGDSWLQEWYFQAQEEKPPSSAGGDVSWSALECSSKRALDETVEEPLKAVLDCRRVLVSMLGESAELGTSFRAVVQEPLVRLFGRFGPVFAPAERWLILTWNTIRHSRIEKSLHSLVQLIGSATPSIAE